MQTHNKLSISTYQVTDVINFWIYSPWKLGFGFQIPSENADSRHLWVSLFPWFLSPPWRGRLRRIQGVRWTYFCFKSLVEKRSGFFNKTIGEKKWTWKMHVLWCFMLTKKTSSNQVLVSILCMVFVSAAGNVHGFQGFDNHQPKRPTGWLSQVRLSGNDFLCFLQRKHLILKWVWPYQRTAGKSIKKKHIYIYIYLKYIRHICTNLSRRISMSFCPTASWCLLSFAVCFIGQESKRPLWGFNSNSISCRGSEKVQFKSQAMGQNKKKHRHYHYISLWPWWFVLHWKW